jgi:predicted dehydrogenase
MMIHNAYNREARRSILAGEIGQVNDLTLHMEFLYGATPEEAATWRCAQPDQIGGPIGDVGSHCLYMAEFLTGSRIRSLQAVFLPEAQPMAVESGAFIRFRTESGLSGTVRVSFADARGNLESTLSNLGYEVFGTRGVLRSFGTLFQLSGLPGEPVRLRLEKEDGGRVETMRLDSPVNIYQSLIADHARSVLSGQRLTGEDGLHNLRCILAAYASARAGGRDVRIP